MANHVFLLITELAARVPAKQRAVKITNTLNAVCTAAYEDGLAGDQLEELIDIITVPSELDQASLATIVKNLYPAGKVSNDIIIKIAATLGHGQAKASFPIQAALLKWIVMVYDVLENPKILAQLYSVLFNLLDTIAIRFVFGTFRTMPTYVLGHLFVI